MASITLPSGWATDTVSRIVSTPLHDEPWRHLRLTNVFPDEVYAEMRRHLPEPESLPPLSTMTTMRRVMDCRTATRFWRTIAADLMPRLKPALEEVFGISGSADEMDVNYDIPGYALPPHTDMPKTALSAVFYLPEDDSGAHMGTMLLRGQDPDPKGLNREWQSFEVVDTVPYVPNAGIIFARTDWSYHAVKETQAPRWTLGYRILA